jgi:hypothetical protein
MAICDRRIDRIGNRLGNIDRAIFLTGLCEQMKLAGNKMKLTVGIIVGTVMLCTSLSGMLAAEPPSANLAAPDHIVISNNPPMVPPAGPGVFVVQKKGPNRFRLVVAGHKFTSQTEIEKYLAYRAAELTQDQKGTWFTFVEARTKGYTVPVVKPDPTGLRYSFRMEYFRPDWRFKLNDSPAWKSWSPFSGNAFFADDTKTIAAFEVSADIVVHKGQMDDTNPLAFEAGAVSDFLVNQVSPPL